MITDEWNVTCCSLEIFGWNEDIWRRSLRVRFYFECKTKRAIVFVFDVEVHGGNIAFVDNSPLCVHIKFLRIRLILSFLPLHLIQLPWPKLYALASKPLFLFILLAVPRTQQCQQKNRRIFSQTITISRELKSNLFDLQFESTCTLQFTLTLHDFNKTLLAKHIFITRNKFHAQRIASFGNIGFN